MRRCSICGEEIAAHTLAPVPMAVIRAIQTTARDPQDAKRRTRAASRRCPLAHHRDEKGIPVFRVVREAA